MRGDQCRAVHESLGACERDDEHDGIHLTDGVHWSTTIDPWAGDNPPTPRAPLAGKPQA